MILISETQNEAMRLRAQRLLEAQTWAAAQKPHLLPDT